MPDTKQFLSIRVLGDEKAAAEFYRRLRMWPRVRGILATKSSYIVKRELMLSYSEGPLQARSNLLERSVGVITQARVGGVSAGAGTKEFYALVHETGMVIYGNPVMHWEEGGKWIHARMVTIPARKPGQHAHENAEPKVQKLWHSTVGRFVT
jgi:hypothetical protein